MSNYKITVEIPREVVTKDSRDLTVDTFTQYFYGVKSKDNALNIFGSIANLKYLRHQGFSLTRVEFKKYRNSFTVEKVK